MVKMKVLKIITYVMVLSAFLVCVYAIGTKATISTSNKNVVSSEVNGAYTSCGGDSSSLFTYEK